MNGPPSFFAADDKIHPDSVLNKRGMTGLMISSKLGHPDCVNVFLRKGASRKLTCFKGKQTGQLSKAIREPQWEVGLWKKQKISDHPEPRFRIEQTWDDQFDDFKQTRPSRLC